MKLKPTIGAFTPESLRLAAALSDIAEFTGKEITADLFSPLRTCTFCHREAELFIGPKHVCISCWANLFRHFSDEAMKKMLSDIGRNH